MLLGLLTGLVGCRSQYAVLSPHLKSCFDDQNYQAVMAELEPRLEATDSPEYTLNLLRYGSSALYGGELERAQQALLRACEELDNFAPDGEFKALLTTESSKDFLGDPYEQMMAFYYLALTDYLRGHYDMSRPSLVTALLADTGSREERYQADSGLVLYMLGKCQQHLNQPKQAAQNFKDISNLKRYQVVLKRSSAAVKKAAGALNSGKDKTVQLAKELYMRELSGNAWLHLDAAITLKQAAESAEATIQYYTENPQKSEDPASWRKIKPKRHEIIKAIFDLSHKAVELLETVELPELQKEFEQFDQTLKAMTQAENNTLFILELGKGPVKYQSGEYGSQLSYRPSYYPERSCQIRWGDRPAVHSLKLDDLYYQCSTRGGRKMDDILKGKAIFKDFTRVAAAATLVAGNILYDSDGQKAGNIAVASGLALAVISAATTPQADIRQWEFLPGEIHVIATQLPLGEQTITLDYLDKQDARIPGQTYSYQVTIEPNQENVFLIRSGHLIHAQTENEHTSLERVNP